MKKLLTILGAVGLTATSASVVVSCNKGDDNKSELIKPTAFTITGKQLQQQIIEGLKITENKTFKSESDVNEQLKNVEFKETKYIKFVSDFKPGVRSNQKAENPPIEPTTNDKNQILVTAIRYSKKANGTHTIKTEYFKSNGEIWVPAKSGTSIFIGGDNLDIKFEV